MAGVCPPLDFELWRHLQLGECGKWGDLAKKIALRLLSENKVTFMKGAFKNLLLSKIVESIWFDAYGMGLLWNLLLSDYLVNSYDYPDWRWRAWEIQCHCCCLFGSVELFKGNSKSVVFDMKKPHCFCCQSLFLSKVMSWSYLLSLRMEVLLRFSFFIAQLKRKQHWLATFHPSLVGTSHTSYSFFNRFLNF